MVALQRCLVSLCRVTHSFHMFPFIATSRIKRQSLHEALSHHYSAHVKSAKREASGLSRACNAHMKTSILIPWLYLLLVHGF